MIQIYTYIASKKNKHLTQREKLLAYLILSIVILHLLAVIHFDFISLDDDVYVTQIPT
jgi:cytochrome b561